MRKHRQKNKQEIEDTEDDDFFVFESDEVRERFLRILWESVDKLPSIEEADEPERPPATKRHMLRMNRLFRERFGGSFLPFPEADNFYQRARSKIIVKLRINKLMYRLEEHRRQRRIKKYEKRYNVW